MYDEIRRTLYTPSHWVQTFFIGILNPHSIREPVGCVSIDVFTLPKYLEINCQDPLFIVQTVKYFPILIQAVPVHKRRLLFRIDFVHPDLIESCFFEFLEHYLIIYPGVPVGLVVTHLRHLLSDRLHAARQQAH